VTVDYVLLITSADIPERPKTRHAHYEDIFGACALGIRAAPSASQIRLFRVGRLAHTSAADELRSSTITFARIATGLWRMKDSVVWMRQGHASILEDERAHG
jgi:hypothetical protein